MEQKFSASRAIDIAAPAVVMAATASSITSTTTSGTITYSKIEEKSGWYTYPDQGNPVCSSKPAMVNTPSLDGISGEFYLGPKGQYNNCLWTILLGKSNTATQFPLAVHYC